MDKNTQEQKVRLIAPPYGSYKTFMNFIEGLRQVGDLPNVIDRSVMLNLSGATQSHLMHTLKSLGLIDDKGIPTPKLDKLIKASEQEMVQVFDEIVSSAYSFLYEPNIIKSGSTKSFEDRFRETGASGETLTRCISFFTNLAKAAQIELSPHLKPYRTARKVVEGKPKQRKQKNHMDEESAMIKQPASESPDNPSEIKLWMDKFPAFNEEWEESLKQEWIKNWRETFDWLTSKKS